jgi:signal transduction histidine kinase/uncharacterized membrane protein
MAAGTSGPGGARQRWLLAALLGVLGFLVNLVPVQLSPGIDLIFGGVAFLIAAVAFGPGPGLLAAAIASLPTIWLWNHPYAWVIFSLEGLFVGWLVLRWQRRPLVANALYWALVGVGLITLFYFAVLGLRGTTFTVILLKQPFNGLINAVLVEMLLLLPVVRRLLRLRGAPRLQSSLAVVVTLAAVLPTLLFGLWVGRQEWKRNVERTEAQLELIVRAYTAQLAQYISLHESSVRSVSELTEARGEFDPVQLQRRITAEQQQFGGFLNMYVADANARSVAFAPATESAGRSLIGLEFSDRAYYRQLVETRGTVISDVFAGRGGTEQPLIVIAHPIILADTVAGYVAGALDLSRIPRVQPAHGRRERVRVIDRQGTIVFDTYDGDARSELSSIDGTATFDAVRRVDSVAIVEYQAEPATAAAAATAARMLAAVAHLPSLGWWAWVEQPFAEVQAFVGRAYTRLFALLTAVMLIALLVSDVLSHYLVAPLLRVRGAAVALARGDQRARAGSLTAYVPTEVRELGRSFDDMADTLLAYTHELEELGEITRSLASTLETDELLRLVTDAATRLVSADGCAILLLDAEHGELEAKRHASGILAPLAERRIPVADSRFGAAVQTGRLEVLTEIPSAEPLYRGLPPGTRLHSAMAAPLIGRSGSLGLLVAARAGKQPIAFALAEQRLLDRLARTAAVAVENAALLEAAESASRAKSDFIATMSHELRTPLNAVLGHLELLQLGIHGEINERQHQALTRVQAASRHLRGLIEEVLSFSRLEAGRIEVHYEPTDLCALAEEVVAVIEPLAAEKGLRLTTRPCQLLGSVETDPDKVRQILINLAGNAVKFTEQGEVEIDFAAWDGSVALTVRDTGPGIPAEQQQRLFRPFEQLDSGFARAHGGAGLGLYLSSRYAELIGGRIEVESEIGRGSTFTLVLPAERADEVRAGR